MSVRLDNVSVSFGDTRAVDSVDLAIDSGERFAVMGPSGSGKSTLLRAIAGLEESTGEIAIDGVSMAGVPTHRRPIGMMFQDYALFPHMDVAGNVAFGLTVGGMDRSTAMDRARDLLDVVGLAGFGDRNVATLSGGEQQRVALARTLAPGPSVVMFDEPLGATDQGLKDSLLAEMRHVIDDVGITSIYVTHDRHEAEAFATRIGIMRAGELIRTGTPSALWSDPGTPFVARFVGHRNIVEARPLGLGTAIVVVPARAITVAENGRLPAIVTDCGFRDGEYDVTMTVAGQDLATITDTPIAPGAEVGLEIDASKVAELAVDEV